MDPLTITAAFVNVSVIVIQVAKLTQKLVAIDDPRIKMIRSKLISDRRKFVNWYLALGIQDIKDLEPNVRPEDYQMVVECFEDVQKYSELAFKKVLKLDALEKRNLRSIGAKIRWIYGEFDELTLLADTLREMVNTLYTIAPPPPWYDRVVETSSGGPTMVSPPCNREDPTAASQAVESLPERPNVEIGRESGPVTTTPLSNLYEKCKDALQLIRAQTKGRPEGVVIEKILFRFNTWGADLLDGRPSPDRLMKAEALQDGDTNPLKTAIVLVLVDIALIEDQVLGFLSQTCSDQECRRVEHLQLEVIAILGIDGVEDVAAQRCAPDLGDEENEGILLKGIDLLLLAVEDLYELLPSIRTARREHFLLAEETSVSKGQLVPLTSTSAAKSAIPAPPKDANLSDWVDWSVDSTTYLELQLSHKMKNDDNASSSTDRKYYEMLKKQGEKLKEWAESVSNIETSSLRDHKEEEIRQILMLHQQNLPKAVANSSSSEGNVQVSLDEKSLMKYYESMKSVNENLFSLGGHEGGSS